MTETVSTTSTARTTYTGTADGVTWYVKAARHEGYVWGTGKGTGMEALVGWTGTREDATAQARAWCKVLACQQALEAAWAAYDDTPGDKL